MKNEAACQKRVAGWNLLDWIAVGVGVLLLLAGTFWDLQISQKLNAPKSPFTEFLYRIGELPGYIFLPFATMVFFYAPLSPVAVRKWADVLWKIVFCALTVLAFYLLWEKIGDYWMPDDDYRSLFVVIWALLSTGGFLWLLSAVPRQTFVRLRRYALYVVVVFLFTTLLIEVLKGVAGRARFRDVLKGEKPYTPWYRWGLDNGKSFPSGHAGAAAALFMLTALPNVYEKLKKYNVVFMAAPLVFSLLVGLARILAGGHFVSDVAASLLITYLSARLISFLFWQKE